MCCPNDNTTMTSPVNTKGDEKQQNGNTEEKAKNEKKSPAHSLNGTNKAPSRAESPAGEPLEQPEPFAWFRIFKIADLMVKQGC